MVSDLIRTSKLNEHAKTILQFILSKDEVGVTAQQIAWSLDRTDVDKFTPILMAEGLIEKDDRGRYHTTDEAGSELNRWQ